MINVKDFNTKDSMMEILVKAKNVAQAKFILSILDSGIVYYCHNNVHNVFTQHIINNIKIRNFSI